MNTGRVIGVAAVAAVLSGAALHAGDPPGAVVHLTLRDAVTRALARSHRMLDSDERIAEAQLEARAVRGALLPSFTPSLYGSLGSTTLAGQRYGAEFAQTFLTGTELRVATGATVARNQLGSYFWNETNVMVRQPLLELFGGGVRQTIRRAEGEVAHARIERETAAQAVIVDVASAYLAAITQSVRVSAAASSAARARLLADAAGARLAAGKASQLDVLRAGQLSAYARTEQIDAERGLDDAHDRLRELIGLALDDVLVLAPLSPDPAPWTPPADGLAAVIAERADVRAATLRLASARTAAAQAITASRPQIDLQAAVTRQSVSDSLFGSFGVNQFRFTTLATVSLAPRRRDSGVAAQRAELQTERRQRELDDLVRRATLEARAALRRQQQADAALAVAIESAALAAREIEVAQSRYEHGLGTMLDVVQAEANRLSSDVAVVAARSAVALARLQVRAAASGIVAERDLW